MCLVVVVTFVAAVIVALPCSWVQVSGDGLALVSFSVKSEKERREKERGRDR